MSHFKINLKKNKKGRNFLKICWHNLVNYLSLYLHFNVQYTSPLFTALVVCCCIFIQAAILCLIGEKPGTFPISRRKATAHSKNDAKNVNQSQGSSSSPPRRQTSKKGRQCQTATHKGCKKTNIFFISCFKNLYDRCSI